MKKSLRFILSLKYWQVMIFLVMVAFSLRVARCLIVDRISKDGVLYVRMAEGVVSSAKEKAYIENRRMPPLYILLIAEVHKMGPSFELAATMISVIAGTLLIIPFFLVVRLFFGDKAAFISGFLVAVHPSLVKISSTIMRDSLFLCLMVYSFAFVVFAIHKKKYLFWGIGGLFAALAATTRAEGFEMVVAVVLWAVVDIIFGKKLRESQKKSQPAEGGGSGESIARENDISDFPSSPDPVSNVSVRNQGVWIRAVAGVLIFIFLFFITSYPISASVKGTASTWSIIDKRIIGYAKSILFNSSEHVLRREDTL